MSISDRPARVLSLALIVVLATIAGGWTSAERDTRRTCHQQAPQCTPKASLTRCCSGHSTPADPARLPPIAHRLATPCTLSLMAVPLPSVSSNIPRHAITTRHWHRRIRLPILLSIFLI